MSLDVLSLLVPVPWSLIGRGEEMYAPGTSGELGQTGRPSSAIEPAAASAIRPRARNSESDDSEGSCRQDAEEIYTRHLPLIGRISLSVCRRHGVVGHDAEDFASDVLLKLCANEYAVIRKFQNKSSFATYLRVVISKTFLDYRRRLWGKWTPSAQAKRFGAIGVQLEKLIYRDKHSFDAACDILIQKHSLTIDRQALREMFAKLPRRSAPCQIDGDYEISHVASVDEADSGVISHERDQRIAEAMLALHAALRALPDDDRAIIRLLYFERMSIADIARGLRLDQKRLYPRIQRLLAALRKSLADRHISPDVLRDLDPG